MGSDRRFTIEGRDLGYPTSFRDGSAMMAAFAVPRDAAEAVLADVPFEPARLLPGRAVLSLNCVHYVDTDCDAYDEVALAILVEADREPRSGLAGRLPGPRSWTGLVDCTTGAHSWRLGVSTTLARDCGIRMWGYPKVVGDVRFTRDGDRAEMAWVQDGDLVLRFRAPATGRRAPRPIASSVYSIHRGMPHVGQLRQRLRGVGLHLRGTRLELGRHDVADELRALGLPRRPLATVWAEHLDFSMGPPEPLDDDAHRRPDQRSKR